MYIDFIKISLKIYNFLKFFFFLIYLKILKTKYKLYRNLKISRYLY